MPVWLINVIITIAIKVGLPWVVQHIPGIPQAVIDVIKKLLEDLQKPDVSNSAAKKQALAAVRDLQVSPSAPDTKRI